MRIFILSLTIIFLLGCEAGSDKTPEQIQAEIAASQKQFALEKERIERENAKYQEKIAQQRSFVIANFVSVDTNRIEVLLTNNTDKPIDNQSGALEIFDINGDYVTGIGLTNWVPGDVYLPIGTSAKAVKSLELESPEQREKIVTDAASYQYHFTIQRIQFVGEDEISFL